MAQWSKDHRPMTQRDRPTVTIEATEPMEPVRLLLQARHVSDRHPATD
jgi:hypothetical protein